MTLTGATAAQDFQAVQFDLILDDLTPADFGGWVGNNPNFDPAGPPPPAPIFANNSDGGSGPNDFERIAVFATSPTGVKGMQPGEAAPFTLGTAYVQWDGTATNNSFGLRVQPNGALPWGIYEGTTPTAMDGSMFTTNGGEVMFQLGGTVNPPVIANADLGDRIRGAIINHMFVNTGGEATFSPTINTTGPGAPLNAPTITTGGAFSWNSNGSPFGSYTFEVSASNQGGSDVATLTVDIIVPEPATLSLVGLAMVGIVGLVRRRS
jgi:hypothetical protein